MTTIQQNRKSYLIGACLAVALLCWVGIGSKLALAQKPTSEAARAIPVEQAIPAEIDSERGALDRFLDSHPEIQNDVLSESRRINDPNYIHDHAELQAFLESHPLVKADPRAFISPQNWRFQNRRSDTDNLLSWFIPFSVFVCMLLAVLWVVRTILENRRWNKSLKVHEDVHTKLIEKFASGLELTAYMESEAGRRLLQWTPPTDEGRMPFAAGRILRSFQAGLILGLAGAGMLSVRSNISDSAGPLLVFGTLGLAIGVGFVLSAILSYGISKRLGLLGGPDQSGAQAGTSLGRAQ